MNVYKLNNNGLKYKEYVDQHISYVKTVWRWIKFKHPGFLHDFNFYRELENIIMNHDISKYSCVEFDGYRKFFYPDTGQRKNRLEFNLAWNHHQKTNPHHWEYWVLICKGGTTKPLPMPLEYVIEMLCDWCAMSLKFGGSPSSFYETTKGDMLLNSDTIKLIEEWIPLFDHCFMDLADHFFTTKAV